MESLCPSCKAWWLTAATAACRRCWPGNSGCRGTGFGVKPSTPATSARLPCPWRGPRGHRERANGFELEVNQTAIRPKEKSAATVERQPRVKDCKRLPINHLHDERHEGLTMH